MIKHYFRSFATALGLFIPATMSAQCELYPQHFNLEEVTLTASPLKQAQNDNARLLLDYDADRLMTPFIRQAGLHLVSGGQYNGWLSKHPSFSNWGLSNWSLEGHVGGHYLSALALAYAAEDDATLRVQLKTRLDYCLNIMKDCQEAYNDNTEGLYGFIGGQPINQVWTGLYKNDLAAFKQYGGWVPFYCQHKILAGLRDAWIYAGSDIAKECFRKLCDWSVNVVSKLSIADMQTVLGWEHGGMNETLADAYRLFNDDRYLAAAKKYSHTKEVNGMQTLNKTFLDGQHANTQVPKFIGFERIYQEDASMTSYKIAARNFWTDVTQNRTVCIGGNSTSEHFFNVSQSERYINDLDGPESCNSNNMLKLSENLFDDTHDAKYADFYEQTMYNHILSARDPDTGGYVYFTTLRPQGYRIYSQVNQGMWCCVGTGMENHSKYAHFAYTHSSDNQTLYVNLFVPSVLNSNQFGLKQETAYPFPQTAVEGNSANGSTAIATTTLTLTKGGSFTLALRHPAWTGSDYAVLVNGQQQTINVSEGTASYATISRTWQAGDVVTVKIPMSLRYEECPGLSDYIAFKYGPVLLAARTTAASAAEAEQTGLEYESLQNEYGGEGRMDHAPGSRATKKSLNSAALLIGNRADLLSQITPKDITKLQFAIQPSDAGTGHWGELTLEPFYGIHHARYQCYWYSQTPEAYAQSEMGQADAAAEALAARTIDFVSPGEQQSEAGHDYAYSSESTTGSYNGETYRDAKANGYIQYTLFNPEQKKDSLAIMLRFTTADKGRMGTLTVDGTPIASITVVSSASGQDANGFYNVEFEIPQRLRYDSNGEVKKQFVVRLTASATTLIPGLYGMRLVSGYDPHDYCFVAREWITGDAGRVNQNRIVYNDADNTLTVQATGWNNVALQLDYADCNYTLTNDLKYLIVEGTNLNQTTGASYLWWLNGVNKGSQVAPTTTFTNEQNNIVVAWDMTKSNLNGNNQGERFSICQGMTIFGLTSTTGTSVIKNIGFYASVDDYQSATGMKHLTMSAANNDNTYELSGLRRVNDSESMPHGVYIKNGKKLRR